MAWMTSPSPPSLQHPTCQLEIIINPNKRIHVEVDNPWKLLNEVILLQLQITSSDNWIVRTIERKYIVQIKISISSLHVYKLLPVRQTQV